MLLGFRPKIVFLQVDLDLLIDGGVHEKRQDHWRRTVDGHGHRGVGRAQVKAGVELLHVVQRSNAHAGVTHLAVDVGPGMRVFTIQCHGVKSRAEPHRRLALGQ
jgi:hypothetical protein